MNMSPKVRPLWQRLLLMFGTSILWAYKALHLPRFILPRDFKSVVNNWTHEMFWVLIKSRLHAGVHRSAVLLQNADVVQAEGPGGAAVSNERRRRSASSIRRASWVRSMPSATTK